MGAVEKGYCAVIDGRITIGVADNSPLFERQRKRAATSSANTHWSTMVAWSRTSRRTSRSAVICDRRGRNHDGRLLLARIVPRLRTGIGRPRRDASDLSGRLDLLRLGYGRRRQSCGVRLRKQPQPTQEYKLYRLEKTEMIISSYNNILWKSKNKFVFSWVLY